MFDTEAYVRNCVRPIVLNFIVAKIKARECGGLHLPHAATHHHCPIVTQVVSSDVKLLYAFEQ